MNQLFRVDGKTALVTGARRGIGRAFAASLAHAGADIVAVSKSSSAPETEKLVNDAGRNFTYYSCDFTSRESVYTLIKTLEENNTEIDILVNNAGTIQRRPAAEHPDEYWDEVIAANLSSQFILTRELIDLYTRSSNSFVPALPIWLIYTRHRINLATDRLQSVRNNSWPH